MSNRYHRPITTPLSNRRNKKYAPQSSTSILGSVSRAAATAATASTVVLTAQAAHVAWKTPRLPPPPNSGYDFPLNGLVTLYSDNGEQGEVDREDGEVLDMEKYALNSPMPLQQHHNGDDEDEDAEDDNHQEEKKTDKSSPPSSPPPRSTSSNPEDGEFNLVLIGDSPTEGIGNDTHRSALSGQTAKSFSKMLCNGKQGRRHHRPVRYWSFGLSGLTAKGIEDCMVPLLHKIGDSRVDGKKYTRSHLRRGGSRAIDAVVVSCGVNNVLWGQSATAFGLELKSLIKSVRSAPGCEHAAILVMGLPDFSRMPFLPWPLSSVAGWRGHALRDEMEKVVEEMKREEEGEEMYVDEKGGRGVLRQNGIRRGTIALATLPEVEDVLGAVKEDDCLKPTTKMANTALEDEKPVHPLLDHLKHDPNLLSSLEIKDFFADDGFHPGKHGTILLGNLLSRVYAESMGMKPGRLD